MKKLLLFTLASLPLFAAAQVPSYVPTNGLVGWWPFNGNANDESGNGNNGTVNGATLTTDRNGNVNAAYSFDGVNDGIVTPDFNFPMGSADRSISFWMQDESVGNYCSIPLRYGIHSPNNGCWILHSNSCNVNYPNGVLRADFYNSGVWSNTTMPNNQWGMVTMTLQNNTCTLYLNAINIGQGQIIANTISSNSRFYIGGDSVSIPNYFFSGDIDDIGIWNRALTPCEIEALYNSGNSGLTLTTSATNLCVSDGSATLLALPSGGTWSGTGVTGNAFNPAVSGAGTFYPVYTVTNASGCVVSDSIAITVDVCAGITENASSTFTIFPNPANNNVTVSWSAADVKTLTLTDAAGRAVRTYNVTGTQAQLSLEGLASGVYFLSVGEDAKAVQRIFKQ